MILTDAGPLIALIDSGEPDHESCVAALEHLSAPMVTTWPALTEAMYLLGSAGGWTAQDALWRLVLRGDLEISTPTAAERQRARDLMEQYKDLPMDLADASLVATAESLEVTRVFTLDAHFHVYRLPGKRRFEVIPGA